MFELDRNVRDSRGAVGGGDAESSLKGTSARMNGVVISLFRYVPQYERSAFPAQRSGFRPRRPYSGWAGLPEAGESEFLISSTEV